MDSKGAEDKQTRKVMTIYVVFTLRVMLTGFICQEEKWTRFNKLRKMYPEHTLEIVTVKASGVVDVETAIKPKSKKGSSRRRSEIMEMNENA